MKSNSMETWWCYRCDETVVCIPATEVRCRKGHRMKRAASEKELNLAKAAEGNT